MGYQIETRVRLTEHGDAGDRALYVFLGSACIGKVWREAERTKVGDFDGVKYVWRSSVTPQNVWPTKAIAVRMTVQELWGVVTFEDEDGDRLDDLPHPWDREQEAARDREASR